MIFKTCGSKIHAVPWAFLLTVALLLSGCGANADPDPAASVPVTASDTPEPVSETPEPSEPVISDAEKKALENYGAIVSEAAEKIEECRRDDLPSETTPFEGCLPCPDNPNLTREQSDYFEAVCALIVDGMPEGLSAYDRYRYLAFVLSLTTEYDYEEKSGSDTSYGAIINGEGVCLGYSGAYLCLCEKADLWCETVTGYASWNGEEHGWNLVMLPEGSYYIDVTWCDQYGEIGSPSWQGAFMLTEEALAMDHGIWTGGPATGKVIYNQ